MEIVFLDRSTLGFDINLDKFNLYGNVTIYNTTAKEKTLQRVKHADIVISNKVVLDKNILENSTIKLICIAATGTNNVDIEYAKANNIEVKNVSAYSTNSVAQLTMTLALNFIQNIPYYNNYVYDGGWEKSDIFTNIDKPFFEISEKNWGIIGLGNIGMKVAYLAKAFGANVSFYSTSGKNNNTNYNTQTLNELLKTSDIISIHCPLNSDTEDLLNYENMKLLKDKSIIINVARGGIINEADIVKIVNEREIYFALDSVTKEPIESNSILRTLANDGKVIITPHIAWASIESRNRLVNGIINNISEYIQ